MAFYHFFNTNQDQQNTTSTQSCEQRLARLHHHLMVLKANATNEHFPQQEVINQAHQEIEELKDILGNMFMEQVTQGISLSLLEQKAEELHKYKALSFKKIENIEPPTRP